MFYKHQYFQLNTQSKKVFDENSKELYLTGNSYRMLNLLCEKGSLNLTEIGEYLDRAKDFTDNTLRQYRHKIKTAIGRDIVEYKNKVYSIIGKVEEIQEEKGHIILNTPNKKERNTPLLRPKEYDENINNKPNKIDVFKKKVENIEKNVWIFQANPSGFRINDLLRDRNKSSKMITWAIRQPQFNNKINVGDMAYVWRSNGKVPDSGGIIAKGKILCRPQILQADDSEYIIPGPEGDRLLAHPNDMSVRIKIDEIRLNEECGILKRSVIKLFQEQYNFRIIMVSRETNYLLNNKQAELLESLWIANRR